jgi:tripartite-type tricarboxylate transporter receptor subunit TctC
LNEEMGIKFNIVTGYPGGGEIDLGIERGELHCRNLTISTYFAREPFLTWHKNGFVRPIMQTAKKRDARVSDVPTIYELMDQYKTPETNRRVATVLLAPAIFGRPMVATPGVPPDRVKILRDAYHASLKDPALLEDLKKRRWEVDAVSGEEMANLAKEVISQPPEVIEQMKKLLGN